MKPTQSQTAIVPTHLQRTHKSMSLSLQRDTRGLTTVEYLIMLVVVAVAGIGVWKNVADGVKTKADTANTSLKDME